MSPSSRMIWPLPASDVPRPRLPPTPTEPSRDEPPPEPVPPPAPVPHRSRCRLGRHQTCCCRRRHPRRQAEGRTRQKAKGAYAAQPSWLSLSCEQRTNCCKSMDWVDPCDHAACTCGMHALPTGHAQQWPWIVEIFKVYGRNAGSGIKFPTRRLATPTGTECGRLVNLKFAERGSHETRSTFRWMRSAGRRMR